MASILVAREAVSRSILSLIKPRSLERESSIYLIDEILSLASLSIRSLSKAHFSSTNRLILASETFRSLMWCATIFMASSSTLSAYSLTALSVSAKSPISSFEILPNCLIVLLLCVWAQSVAHCSQMQALRVLPPVQILDGAESLSFFQHQLSVQASDCWSSQSA